MNLDEQIEWMGETKPTLEGMAVFRSLRELKRLREEVTRFLITFEHGDPTDQDELDRAFAALKELSGGQ